MNLVLENWIENHFMIDHWNGKEVVAVCPICFENNIACNIHITKEGFHCSTCGESGSLKKLFEFFAEEYFNLDNLELVDTYWYTDCEHKDLDVSVGKYKNPEGKRFYTTHVR